MRGLLHTQGKKKAKLCVGLLLGLALTACTEPSSPRREIGLPGEAQSATPTTPISVGTASDWKAVRATAGFGGAGVGSSAAIR
jgi:hypothetical protein